MGKGRRKQHVAEDKDKGGHVVCRMLMLKRRRSVGAHLQSTLPFSRPTAGNFPVDVVGGDGGGGEGDMGSDTYDVRRNGLKRAHRGENGLV